MLFLRFVEDFKQNYAHIYLTAVTTAVPLDETHLDAVRGLIQLQGFHPSASTSGARQSDAAMSDKAKQICLSTLPRTGFDTEVCSYLAFHS